MVPEGVGSAQETLAQEAEDCEDQGERESDGDLDEGTDDETRGQPALNVPSSCFLTDGRAHLRLQFALVRGHSEELIRPRIFAIPSYRRWQFDPASVQRAIKDMDRGDLSLQKITKARARKPGRAPFDASTAR
jgi:hypothetical protein